MSSKKRSKRYEKPISRSPTARSRHRTDTSGSETGSSYLARVAPGTPLAQMGWPGLLLSGLVAAGLYLWLFAGDLMGLVRIWESEPDYSHGYLVIPFALMIAWWRRDLFPYDSLVPGWGGIAVLLASLGVAFVGTRLFLVPMAGWAMVIWLCGACWLILGRKAFLWAFPSLLFLFFMVPLPFRFEQLMSWRLQLIATQISTWILQILGQPAIAESNIVYLGDQVLEVEQACSGLRMFMGIAAVAFVFIVLTRRAWWERLLVVLAVAPIAIIANSVRVVVTGLLLQVVSSEAARTFSHDVAGWAMVLMATAMFGAFLAYLRLLVVDVNLDTARAVLDRSAARNIATADDGT